MFATAQGGVKFASGLDFELGEDLAQMPLHSAGAQEQLRTDFGVDASLACQLRDLILLRSQFGAARAVGSPTHFLPRRLELTASALGESFGAWPVGWSVARVSDGREDVQEAGTFEEAKFAQAPGGRG
jgi:hypothetical protein